MSDLEARARAMFRKQLGLIVASPAECEEAAIRAIVTALADPAGDGDLRGAAQAIHDDLLMRAKMNAWENDGEIVVDVGCGVWSRLCAALSPAPPASIGEG